MSIFTFNRASGATYFDKDGVMRMAGMDEPRLDHDPDTKEPLGLLVEKQSTNKLFPSENLLYSKWVKTRMTVMSEGEYNGMKLWKLVPDTSTEKSHQISCRIDFPELTEPTPYCASFIAKSDGTDTTRISIRSYDSIGFLAYSFVDLNTGQSYTSAGSGSPVVRTKSFGNGFWKISVSVPIRTGSVFTGMQIFAASPHGNSTTVHNFNGIDGYVIGIPQMEVGAYASSYIPTTDSEVTRATDQPYIKDGWSLQGAIRPDESTMMIEFDLGERKEVRFIDRSGGENGYVFTVRSTGSFQSAISSTNYYFNMPTDDFVGYDSVAKIASSIKTGEPIRSAHNGKSGQGSVIVGNDIGTTGDILIGYSRIANTCINGHIKRLTIIPRALSLSELEEITK